MINLMIFLITLQGVQTDTLCVDTCIVQVEQETTYREMNLKLMRIKEKLIERELRKQQEQINEPQ